MLWICSEFLFWLYPEPVLDKFWISVPNMIWFSYGYVWFCYGYVPTSVLITQPLRQFGVPGGIIDPMDLFDIFSSVMFWYDQISSVMFRYIMSSSVKLCSELVICVMCSILFWFCKIFDYLLFMWYIIYFWDFCWDRKLLLGRWGEIFGVMLPKRYAIYAFPVWSKYANYALYLIICGVPSGTIMFVCVIWICFCILILMPLLHDFCEFRIHICDAMTLWYGMLFMHFLCSVPEWNHYVRLCDFEYVSAFWFWCHYCMTSVNSVYIMLYDDFVLWIWNPCIFLIGFWVISGFVWHSGSLVEHWSNGPFR